MEGLLSTGLTCIVSKIEAALRLPGGPGIGITASIFFGALTQSNDFKAMRCHIDSPWGGVIGELYWGPIC